MSLLDWAIVAVAAVLLRLASLSTRRYMKGVADFLSANRAAGRYLLTIGNQMSVTGVIAFVAAFEAVYLAGFPTGGWWSMMQLPIGMLIILTGWVYYRFRETRAMTMAQFLEMRYGRRLRVFAGILCWTSGIINFGIFPAVAARFFIYFCGLPEHFHIPGIQLSVSTFATIMALDLAFALTFVNMGGQVSIMITECLQGIFCSVAFIVVSASVLVQLKWHQIVQALNMAPANQSMLHPFDTSQVKDFNVWYMLIITFSAFYGYMSWQGSSGFNSSARSPHEQKMGGIISVWRYLPQGLMTLLLPLAAYTVMHLPEFSAKAAVINEVAGHIGNPAIKNQMLVPIALAHFLPIGIKGLLATVMLFASFTCHDTYMHSWGSIFIQDVVMPLRKKPFEPEQHIRLLRWSIIGVAIFAFFFSLFYFQTDKILMYQAISGTIWLGGSGAVIIGGLYWKRGTTSAAYCALIVGAVLGSLGLIVPNIYKQVYHRDFPVNGAVIMFIAMMSAISLYVIVSVITSRGKREFDLDLMLHRGKNALSSDEREKEASLPSRWQQVIGITKEFSLGDRILAILLLCWQLGWFAFFVIITAMNLVHKFPTAWWAEFWHYWIYIYLVIGIPSTIWFAIGGAIDIRALFKALATDVRDITDDGRVVHEPVATRIPQSEFDQHEEHINKTETQKTR